MGKTDFLLSVEILCRIFDGSVVSWVRTMHRNNLLRGDADSLHLRGFAADVAYDDPTDLSAIEVCADTLGLKVRREPDYDHFEPKRKET